MITFVSLGKAIATWWASGRLAVDAIGTIGMMVGLRKKEAPIVEKTGESGMIISLWSGRTYVVSWSGIIFDDGLNKFRCWKWLESDSSFGTILP
jgi:hypothetical protein